MYTQRAKTPCQKRAASSDVVDAILAYDARKPRKGANVYFKNRDCRDRELQASREGQCRQTERRPDSYIVASDPAGSYGGASNEKTKFLKLGCQFIILCGLVGSYRR